MQYFLITMQWHKIVILLSLVFLASSQHCTCIPKTVCGWVYLTRSIAECQLPGGRGGFCCPQIVPRTGTRQGLLSERTPSNREGSVNEIIVSPAVPFSPELLGGRKSEISSVDRSNDTTLDTNNHTTIDINHDTTTERTEMTGIVEDEDTTTQEETRGYRLYKKAKKKFDDLNTYARKLLQG